MQSKRKYLGDFVGLIGKEFADEYRREDVLKYKNKLQDKGFEPKTIDTQMMAVVTFTTPSRTPKRKPPSSKPRARARSIS